MQYEQEQRGVKQTCGASQSLSSRASGSSRDEGALNHRTPPPAPLWPPWGAAGSRRPSSAQLSSSPGLNDRAGRGPADRQGQGQGRLSEAAAPAIQPQLSARGCQAPGLWQLNEEDDPAERAFRALICKCVPRTGGWCVLATTTAQAWVAPSGPVLQALLPFALAPVQLPGVPPVLCGLACARGTVNAACSTPPLPA